MAVSFYAYNHTPRLIANQEVAVASLKVMLLSASAAYTAANTTLDQVAGVNTPPRANEVSGNGWTAGGMALANEAWTTVTTNDTKFDATDLSVTASGGDIGPARYAVVFDDAHASKAPLYFVDFGESRTAGDGTPFVFVWHADGLAVISNPL